METEGQFRVIDPETGKPRPKGTEEWTEAEFQAWKRVPWWQKRTIIISYPRVNWFIVLGSLATIVASAFLQTLR